MATFGIGLVAVNLFNDTDRGVYAIFFNAFLVGMTIPWYLVFLPLEARAIQRPVAERQGVLRASLAGGVTVALMSALIVLVAAAAVWGRSPDSVVLPLALTTAATVVLSPIQDHLRRVFHLADESWKAAATSAVQFVIAATFLVVGYFVVDLPTPWLPFGSLVVANTISLMAGFRLADRSPPPMPHTTLRALGQQGIFLLIGAVAPRLGQFLGAIVMAYLIGEAQVGFAEAARVAAQPILVLAFGIGAVVSPRSMSAASTADVDDARRLRRTMTLLMVPTGLVYLAITAADWAWNPVAALVPAAYSVAGLVAVTAIGNIVLSLELPLRAEMIGARLERRYASVTGWWSGVVVAIAASSTFTRAFARPLGELVRGAGQIAGYDTATSSAYRVRRLGIQR